MIKADGYLFRGDAFSSKQAAIEILVHDREQELRFHETWEKEAKPYFFNDNKPKLSIPKKIAEELEQVAVTNWEIWEFFIYAEEFSTELKNWLNHGKDDNANSKIAIAYLAGKALGVELVEVEG